jgi:hypothetical protein
MVTEDMQARLVFRDPAVCIILQFLAWLRSEFVRTVARTLFRHKHFAGQWTKNKERFLCFPRANSNNWSRFFCLSARSHYSASLISPQKAGAVVARTAMAPETKLAMAARTVEHKSPAKKVKAAMAVAVMAIMAEATEAMAEAKGAMVEVMAEAKVGMVEVMAEAMVGMAEAMVAMEAKAVMVETVEVKAEMAAVMMAVGLRR